MDPLLIERALVDVNAMLPGSGRLRLLRAEPDDTAIEMALDLDDVDCADCVLPLDRLHEAVSTTLRRYGVEPSDLLISDTRSSDAPTSAWVTVLDPSGRPAPSNPDPGPTVGDLRGKRIGFRLDVLWACWDLTVEEWRVELERSGATVVTQRRRHGLSGPAGARSQADYDEFVGGVDAIVSGLGNCGSCTSWTLLDGLVGFDHATCAAVVVTEQFRELVGTLAAGHGRPNVRTVVLPHSMHNLSNDEVRAAARRAYPALLDALGAHVR